MKKLISFNLLLGLLGLSIYTTSAQNDSFTSYVDFGSTRSEFPINSFLDVEVGAQQNLAAFWGCDNFVEIFIVDNFAGIDSSGTNTPNPSLGFPATATSDAFFGHTQQINGASNPTAAFEIRNLSYDPNTIGYDTTVVSFFASSMGAGNRQTCYTIIGRDTTTVCLDAANNEDQVVSVRVRPAFRDGLIWLDGFLRIEVTAGPDNDTPEGFFYLNTLSIFNVGVAYTLYPSHYFPISWDTIPKIFEVGEVVPFPFTALFPCPVDIGLQIDGVIVDTIKNLFPIVDNKWEIPNYPSGNARFAMLRINPSYPYGPLAISRPFQIIEPTDSCTVVVLGSESAAGTGPRAIDSLWVNRFRRSYKQFDTRVEVVNLAQDDQSTFQLLPTGSAIPAGINESVDEMNNITAALALNPEAIIINLQAADALRGYDVAQQLANYDEIIQAAGSIPVYITTPQPGDYSTSALDIQLEMRDSTLARFGESAIDFWTPIAEAGGTIDSIYSAVDGLQLSNAGHRLLWQNVIEKQIDTLLTCQRVSSTSAPIAALPLSLKLAPNPTRGETSLSFSLDDAGNVSVEIYNLMGQQVQRLPSVHLGIGDQQISFSASKLAKGVYFLRVEAQNQGSKSYVGVVRLVVQ